MDEPVIRQLTCPSCGKPVDVRSSPRGGVFPKKQRFSPACKRVDRDVVTIGATVLLLVLSYGVCWRDASAKAPRPTSSASRGRDFHGIAKQGRQARSSARRSSRPMAAEGDGYGTPAFTNRIATREGPLSAALKREGEKTHTLGPVQGSTVGARDSSAPAHRACGTRSRRRSLREPRRGFTPGKA